MIIKCSGSALTTCWILCLSCIICGSCSKLVYRLLKREVGGVVKSENQSHIMPVPDDVKIDCTVPPPCGQMKNHIILFDCCIKRFPCHVVLCIKVKLVIWEWFPWKVRSFWKQDKVIEQISNGFSRLCQQALFLKLSIDPHDLNGSISISRLSAQMGISHFLFQNWIV